MNDVRNRDTLAQHLTKRERAAIEIYARSTSLTAAAAVRCADALFDELDTPHELRNPQDNHD